MLQKITKLFKNKFINKIPETKQLGRWNIDYCSKITNTKIDLANEDHCGPCGQYLLFKDNLNKKKNNK
jgi:hypothetical protein